MPPPPGFGFFSGDCFSADKGTKVDVDLKFLALIPSGLHGNILLNDAD